MKFYLVTLFAVLIGLNSLSQRVVQAQLPLSFDWATEDHPEDAMVHAFVKGSEAEITTFVEGHAGKVKYAFRDYLAVVLSAHWLEELSQASFVNHVHFEHHPGQPLLSSSRIHTGVDRVHSGDAALPYPLKGSGVVVGVIDAGVELNHPDFKYPNGNTRVIELWDQTMNYSALRTPSYGYGQVWDSASINDGLCPHTDQTTWFGHGTNTAGIAAGNGSTNPGYTGMAPESELIIVSSNFNAIGWTTTVADAVDYIFSRAEALGKPCVINASIGTYLGSHDARDFAGQLIDADITASEGRIMVCAAGNSGGQAPYHLGYEATADTHFTWFVPQVNAQPGQGSIRFEVFGDVGDMERLQFSIGADRVTPSFSYRGATSFDSIPNRLNLIYTDSLMSFSGNFLAEVVTYADSFNGTYRLQIQIEPIDSVAYRYRFSVTGAGRFDLWSAGWLGLRDMLHQNLPTPAQFAPMALYRSPDIDQSIVSSWACSDKVITVGNMINRTSYVDVDNQTVQLAGQIAGSISPSSSYGPARTGTLKPDVTAPGDNTLTAGAFFQLDNLLNNASQRNRVGVGGLHHRAGGTSSASPVVTGIGALYLELCASGDFSGFKTALTNNTFIEDVYTGELPNNQWGNGKTNAVGALRYASPRPELNFDDNEFCAGESMEVFLEQPFPTMVWNTGDTTVSTLVTQTGQYFASVIDQYGCAGLSDTVVLYRRPVPEKPVVVVDKTMPACASESVGLVVNEVFGAYEWSNGAFTNGIQVTEPGVYACTVSNIFLCSNASDPVEVSFYPEMPVPVLHLQQGGVLRLFVDSLPVSSYLWIINGIEQPSLANKTSIPAQVGLVQAGYVDTNACVHLTDGISVYALGGIEPQAQTSQVYPNPVFQTLNFTTPEGFHFWRLSDASGSLVMEGRAMLGANEISVEGISSGVYQLLLYGPDGAHKTFKVVK